jgi:acetolactate synthase I/II/III large subunit
MTDQDRPGRTVGQLVADTLYAAGVRHAFTVPGESFLGLLEVLGDTGIRVVTARHEGAAGFMAAAYGHLTGRPAALLVTRAVGAANASIALHTAYADSAPMLVVVGQVPRRLRGREAFQEVDLAEIFGALGGWAGECAEPADVPDALAAAVAAALGGRQGPSLLAVPEDVFDEPAPYGVAPVVPQPPEPLVADVETVLGLLAAAERPVIVAGAGVLRAGAATDLTRFAELTEVPVIASWRRGDVIDNEHRLYLGMTGYWAPRTVPARLDRADVLLVVGCRLNDPTTFGYRYPHTGQCWAHVDLVPGLADNPVAADAGAFLRLANEHLIRTGARGSVGPARRTRNEADRAAWLESAAVDGGGWDGPGVHPGLVVASLQKALPADAILATDAGNFAGWAARGYRFRVPHTFLGPTSGAMGYALPAAVAAAVAEPARVVVALAGDGGLGMSLTEIETAVRERTRVVVVCFDNERYGTIRMWQDRRGRGQGVATELGAVDYAAVARGLGAVGVRVDTNDDFDTAFGAALVADRPTLIQVALDRRWVSVDANPVTP